MAINFPQSPSLNDTFTVNSITYTFNGTTWVSNGFIGAAGSINAANDTATTTLYPVMVAGTGNQAAKIATTVTPLSYNASTGAFGVTGNVVGKDSLEIQGAFPQFKLYETDGPANEKNWVWMADGGILELRAYTDDSSAYKTALSIDRTASAIASLTFGNATDNPTFTFSGTGTVSATSFTEGGTLLASKYAALSHTHAYVPAIATADNITTRIAGGFYESSTGTVAEGFPQDSAGWQHILACTHSNEANYYSMQLGASFFDNNIYQRNTQNSGSTAWNLIWTSGNDGSGSGLDADTVDGLHIHTSTNNEANKLVRTDGNGYMQCGYIHSTSGNEGNNSNPSRVWGTNGSDSYMRTYLTSALSVSAAVTFSSTTQNSQFNSIGVNTAGSGTAGEIRATNNITAYYSDDRLKTNLGNIPNALDKVLSLNGFYFEANETAMALGYEKKREVGVSAQQVFAILPEVTAPAPIDEQYLTVRYEKLVALLIEAIKELNEKVERLETARVGDR